jgi:hypothetical protein
VLLVRLKTSENKIRVLKELGDTIQALRVAEEQRNANLEIVQAFKQYFNFCPVYFFYSTYSGQVKKGELTGYFLNDRLEPDSSVRLDNKLYYIAEFSVIEPDTFERDAGSRKLADEGAIAYSRNIEALIIRDQRFIQLSKPFPYYIKTTDLFRRRSVREMVSLMNQELFSFFKMANVSKN